MKNLKSLKVLFIAIFTFLTSCSSGDVEKLIRATPAEFSNLKAASIESKKQYFQFNANEFGVFTTEKGAQIVIDGSCLLKNGNSISGIVDVEMLEFFKRGSMLTTNKPTLGKMPNGDRALLISGGEFYINATHQGDQLQTNCAIQLIVPTGFTNEADNSMTLWCGNGWDNDCDDLCDDLVVWEELENGNEDINIVDADIGQIPIGLECHVIFVSENNGEWLYAIKDITISDGGIISILENELATTNMTALETLLNNLS